MAAQAGQRQEEECVAHARQWQEEECEFETHAGHLQDDPQVFKFVQDNGIMLRETHAAHLQDDPHVFAFVHDNGIVFRDTCFCVKATVEDFCDTKAGWEQEQRRRDRFL